MTLNFQPTHEIDSIVQGKNLKDLVKKKLIIITTAKISKPYVLIASGLKFYIGVINQKQKGKTLNKNC